ncbi:SurA N-terminal domain-containing protein [Thiohalophilus thiocyanatoxydans]|uniref:Periplasmic chaperone PpiD n=1 Tax=Thiohalophilus thiocyanatoxydans TaxID=381308 RepID=A0A4R8IHJ1_9GAMM|nr:SurA N-terminal domain-containing protein [Thiohalophilus thiocyanatoxydans]TDY00076.1 peptidyl-prolyl cis-trans isomerase D [Thiohalophilus thiocyanatoxydans]
MLQLIRDRAQGVFVWVIVGLIIITFALFGLSSYLTGGGEASSVAEVNGTEISENQLLRAQRNYLQRLQQFQGEQFDTSLFDSPRVKREVLQGLISRELIQQHIDEMGYQPGPEQVVNAIREFEVFQEEGSFSGQRYKMLLRQQGLSTEQFERDVASDLASEQLRNGIIQSAFVTDAELERYLRLKHQQRDIGYLELALDRFLDRVELDEGQIEAFYEDNRSRFRSQEKVTLNYLELDLKEQAREYEADEEAVRDYYASHRDNYTEQAGQRRVSHILVAMNDERSQNEARDKAEQLHQQLEDGAEFAELASRHSDDSGSAEQAGDLGRIERGEFDPDFEEVAFELDEGEISAPVKTRFGYHLIKVESVQPARVKPLAEVEDEIREELRMRQAEQDFYEKVSDLERYSYEMPDSLQGVAEQLGLEVKQSAPLTREGGEGVLGNSRVVNAAFSDEVLEEGRNSEVLELSDTHFLVLRVDEHEPAQVKSLEAVKPEIIRYLRQQQAQEMALETAQNLRKELEQGASASTLASRHGAQWRTPGLISRQPGGEDRLDNTLRQTAFRMPPPEEGRPSVTTTALPNGNVAVIRLQAIQTGEVPANNTLQSERQQLSAAFGDSEYNALLESLRRQADIDVSDELSADN